MYNTEFIYAKGLNIIPVVLASEEVSLKYVIDYQIEMNFARDRVISYRPNTYLLCRWNKSGESLRTGSRYNQ